MSEIAISRYLCGSDWLRSRKLSRTAFSNFFVSPEGDFDVLSSGYGPSNSMAHIRSTARRSLLLARRKSLRKLSSTAFGFGANLNRTSSEKSRFHSLAATTAELEEELGEEYPKVYCHGNFGGSPSRVVSVPRVREYLRRVDDRDPRPNRRRNSRNSPPERCLAIGQLAKHRDYAQ